MPIAGSEPQTDISPDASPAPGWPGLARTVGDELRGWTPPDAAQAALRDEYLEFLAERGGDAVRKGGGTRHLTASCFVLSSDRQRVLLCFHRKAQLWLQLGGHLEESDSSALAGALREVREESGIADVTPLAAHPLDVHRHALPSTFGTCREHWDVGYAVVAPDDAVAVTSDESEAVAWWPVDAPPAGAPPDLAARLALVLPQVGGV